MPTTQLTYDGTTSLEDFLHALQYQYYLPSPSAWIKAVYCHLEGEALEWAKNDEEVVRIHYNAFHNVAIDRDGRRLYQLLNERFVTALNRRVDKALKGIKQERQESIEDYYERVKTLFEHVGGQDRSINQSQDGEMRPVYLDWDHSFSLLKVINWFADGLRNTKLRRNMVDTLRNMSNEDKSTVISLHTTCIAAQLKRIMAKRARKLQNQSSVTPQVDTDTSIVVDESPSILAAIPCNLSEISTNTEDTSDTEFIDEIRASWSRKWPAPTPTLPETSTVYESPSVLEEITCNLSESCNEDITNTPGKSVASKSANWSAVPMSLQKSSPEVSFVDESPPVLKQMPRNLPEINAAIVDISDTESSDEILASGPRKWTTAPAAEKEVFDHTVTPHAISKSPPAPHTEKDIEAVEAPDKACAESIVDVETPNQEVFALAALYDALSKNQPASHIKENIEAVKAPDNAIAQSIVDVETLNQEVFALAALYEAYSKNPPASHVKDIEFSAAVDMPSLKHLTEQDGSTTGAFDSVTEIRAPSKNPLIQYTKNSETLEKDSAHIYELSALPIFDLNIDIDFDFCTIDTETVEPHTKIQIPCETTCELPVLPTFDLGIDIDFGTYTTDTETKSFGWSRSCTNSISRRTSSISTCTTVSDVTFDSIETAKTVDTADTEFYEGEQSSCSSVELPVSSATEYSTEDTEFCKGSSLCHPASSILLFQLPLNALLARIRTSMGGSRTAPLLMILLLRLPLLLWIPTRLP